MTDKEMTIEMGNEVEAFIKKYLHVIIKCFGTCKKDRSMNSFYGYEHDAGLHSAKDGKKYWVYFECSICHYQHSFSKMQFFIEHTRIEHKAENKFTMEMDNEDK